MILKHIIPIRNHRQKAHAQNGNSNGDPVQCAAQIQPGAVDSRWWQKDTGRRARPAIGSACFCSSSPLVLVHPRSRSPLVLVHSRSRSPLVLVHPSFLSLSFSFSFLSLSFSFSFLVQASFSFSFSFLVLVLKPRSRSRSRSPCTIVHKHLCNCTIVLVHCCSCNLALGPQCRIGLTPPWRLCVCATRCPKFQGTQTGCQKQAFQKNVRLSISNVLKLNLIKIK